MEYLSNSQSPISLSGQSDLIIFGASIINSSSNGIYLYNCENIIIDSCYIENSQTGINCVKCSNIIVRNCTLLNMKGPKPSGQFIQFNNCIGGMILSNSLFNLPNQSDPEDAISIYQSNGSPSSPILISSNFISGGGHLFQEEV